ncbi:MAG: 50S ribosomal protein L13 [Euryarchaeota archaeon]|nr:50S ribosomal protein L13 [Euryarchaeota archaeon]MBT3653999.1 50S ribosomal protein L13 [Euryarchaeota archaeon]MBT3758191.1 50S ribosomal protein L13 [Euryarchaeota archaeon]MBT4051245.1 50S ribosomal protein L13 [Euryarchaeota archaeon]MBT4346036.1 50S ribosomal protein L13 [Euryarchaeota archaeon]
MAEAGTLVYDATDKVLGRLASHVAKELLSARKAGSPLRVIVVNAEHAIVSGPRSKVFADYDFKYKLNHPRKGPFFPRMPDQIMKRTVRGMLPYQKNSSGRNAVRDLRVLIGQPANLSGEELPDGHAWGDTIHLERPLPLKFVRLGEISSSLGVDATRWGGQ